MSVDTLRETFHINRVTPDKIQDFLTAQTYRPEITKAKEKIKSLPWAYLQDVCKRPIRQGKSPTYIDGTGLICIKPKNTNEMIVSLEETDRINASTRDEVAGQRLQRGDIVITRSGSGTIGRASIFLSDEEVYTNDHLFIVRTDLADSHYTCGFLNTYWGQRLLEAGISGSTGQLNLSNEHIKTITLYTPNELAQKYIGDKIRQAERLQAWSKAVVLNLDAVFSAQYPPLSRYEKYKTKNFRMDARSTFDVLTPESYPPVIGQYFRENEFLTLGELSSDIFIGNTQNNAEGMPNTVFQATSRSCSGLFLRKPFNQVVRPKSGKYLKKFDILLTCGAHDKKYIGKDVSIYHDDKENFPSSKVLVVRLKENKLPAAYVHSYLKSDAGYIQWQSVVRGISAGIHPGDVARIKIPVPLRTKEWDPIHEGADERIALAGKASEIAMQLTNAAKLLVEALIEGQLDEAQLIGAEQALQSGNDQLDRNILNPLKTDGVDGQGQALFSDLDELYRLLAQAEEA